MLRNVGSPTTWTLKGIPLCQEEDLKKAIEASLLDVALTPVDVSMSVVRAPCSLFRSS